MGSAQATPLGATAGIHRYNAFLLLVAGLGGLLYGIDVGIIGGAYPYLADTSGLSPAQLSSIVAAVLGVIHAMGALDQSPELLGGLIGAALVGTFGGIFLSYAVVAPIAQKIKLVRQKQLRLFVLVKQSLIAFMNGAMPQVAIEFGRKTIPSSERPTIDSVENETINGGQAVGEAA